MATQATDLIYIRGFGRDDTIQYWYCIKHLQSSPKELIPVAVMDFERCGSWAVMGEDIYWVGGFKGGKPRTPDDGIRGCKELYKHNIKSEDPSHWDLVSKSKRLRRAEPCVVALADDAKIYVVGGYENKYEGARYFGRRYCGEVYDFTTHRWKPLAMGLNDFGHITCNTAALMDDKKTILYWSMGRSLFYDISLDEFRFEVYRNSTLELDASKYALLNSVKPVISNSILYWFTDDMHLYGYDFKHGKWLLSKSLKKELCKLHDGDAFFSYFPTLVNLYKGKFLLIVVVSPGKLGVAHLSVFVRRDYLDVFVGIVRVFSVLPDFYLLDAMTL